MQVLRWKADAFEFFWRGNSMKISLTADLERREIIVLGHVIGAKYKNMQ